MKKILRFLKSTSEYFRFWRDYVAYQRMEGGQTVPLEIRARLGERSLVSSIDPHYFYQGAWAFEKILKSKTSAHVDIGAEVNWIAVLTRITHVTSIELRPLPATLDNLTTQSGTIYHLPFEDNSVSSLSCLHVAEHIGLGRYGDELDPLGTKKACQELSRVLQRGGNLYFSLPIGKERTVFNAHRIHNPYTILEYFSDLHLVEFSAVLDDGTYQKNAAIGNFTNAKYACGLFHFTKRLKNS